jgi:hypothetical protein
MASFNVTLIQPEGYLHSAALAEVGEYLYWTLQAAGQEVRTSINTFYADLHNVVLGAHLLPAAELAGLPASTVIYNSEQLQDARADRLSDAYKAALERFHVWDYSLNNMPKIANARKNFVPLLFCPELVRTNIPRQRGDALYFYGGLSPRRTAIIAKIRAAGVPVETVTGIYGAARDAQAFNAWAILNLHILDTVTTFAPVRCFYALINGLPVISESAISDPTFHIYRDWIFGDYTADLPAMIAALYGDRAAFDLMAEEKLAAFRATSGKEAMAEAVDAYLAALK